MKALVLEGPGKLNLTAKELGPLGDNACRVRVSNVGVCSSDVSRCFDYAHVYPLIMGHEIAGVVEAVGGNVSGINAKDRVAVFPLKPCFECDQCQVRNFMCCRGYSYYGSRCDGGYSEYLDVESWNLLKIPDDVSLEDAAALEPFSVVLHALRRANLLLDLENIPSVKAKNVVILGAGFLGLLMVKTLKHYYPGLTLHVVDRNQFKLDIAAEFGCKTYLSGSESTNKQVLKTLENLGDITFEMTGAPISFNHSLQIASPGSIIVWVGNISGDLSIPQNLVSSILRKELKIRGTWNSKYDPEDKDDWKDVLKLMQAGIRPSELVTHKIALEEVPNLLDQVLKHRKGEAKFPLIKATVQG